MYGKGYVTWQQIFPLSHLQKQHLQTWQFNATSAFSTYILYIVPKLTLHKFQNYQLKKVQIRHSSTNSTQRSTKLHRFWRMFPWKNIPQNRGKLLYYLNLNQGYIFWGWFPLLYKLLIGGDLHWGRQPSPFPVLDSFKGAFVCGWAVFRGARIDSISAYGLWAPKPDGFRWICWTFWILS